MMLQRNEGMTTTYNRMHDKLDTSSDVAKLRSLAQEMDEAVLAAYGFESMNLNHGFHESKSGSRFTICEAARREVLWRLVELNRIRYEEEVARGLHGGTATRSASRATQGRRTTSADSSQPELDFNSYSPAASRTTDPAATILYFLKTRDGWHAKVDILAVTGIQGRQWNAAINHLMESGKVERQGERRGARYRLIERI